VDVRSERNSNYFSEILHASIARGTASVSALVCGMQKNSCGPSKGGFQRHTKA
jgi:hypothetical protein